MSILHIGSFGFIAFSLAGSFAIHIYLRRQPREALAAVLAGAAYFGCYVFTGGQFSSYVGSQPGTAGAFFGLGSLTTLTIRTIWHAGSDRDEVCRTIRWMVVVPALCTCSMAAVSIASSLTPKTCDLFLYAFDKTLGSPSFVVGQWFQASDALHLVSAIAYNSLPLWISCFLIVRCTHPGESRVDFGIACVALGAVGFVLYQICPGSGPLNSFPKFFPQTQPDIPLSSLRRVVESGLAMRNAMPSLHLGWVLLCFWNSRGLSATMRTVATFYLVFTGLATIGSGEHYLIDLVVAVPLVLCVQAACSSMPERSKARWTALWIAAFITIAWLVSLRTGIAVRYGSPMISWFLVIASTVLCCGLKWYISPPPSQQDLSPRLRPIF